MVKIGEFNLGIKEGDKTEMHFIDKLDDKNVFAFIFQGNLPNNHVWLKATRLYAATGHIQNAPTMAGDMQRKYGFEIHIHAYFLNKILPDFLKHQLPQEYKRKDEYQETLKNIGIRMEQAKTAAFDTQSAPNIGKIYAADYQKIKTDYETLLREWQELEQRYHKEKQELEKLATNANAAIFTISISSDMKVVPDGSAVPLALKDCLQELNMRHNALINDAMMQNIRFAVVKQPYFFFLSELAGIFNPVLLANQAIGDISIFELYKEMFPAINAKSMLQANLENMRHLSSNAPAEMLRRILQQMEISVPVIMPPAPPMHTQGAQGEERRIIRNDYLTKGVLIGHDINNDPVKIDFRNLFRHITIEGSTMQGKSHFCKLFVERAVREGGMKAIVVDVSRGWTRIVERLNGKIFDTKLDMHEALKYNLSLCMVREDALDSNERDFLKPIYDYLTQERSKVRRKEKDIILVIDEAHNFSKRAKAGVLVSIAKEIGKFGVILVLISQRDQGINVEARSQATFHINTPISKSYHKSYADLFGKEIADIMLGLPERHLWLYGNQINVPFDMKPLDYEEGEWLTDEEIEKYRYVGFDKTPEPEKQEPAPQVSANVNEVKISSSEQKPKEPEKPKDELNERERKIIAILQKHGGVCESSNKLFGVIGMKTGESTLEIEKALQEKGYIVVEKQGRTKKVIRMTEKGR